MAQPTTRVGLVGFGLHCRRAYWKCLTKFLTQSTCDSVNVQIPVLIDVIDKKNDIERFLHQQPAKYQAIVPQHCIYVQPSHVDHNNLDKHVLNKLQSHKLDALLISTDPRSRKPYFEYAIQNNMKVLCDKPLFVFPHKNMNTDTTASDHWLSAYTNMCSLLRDTKLAQTTSEKQTDILLLCQRRRHRAHMFVANYLKEFIAEFQIPMNFIHIHHSDGLFLTPYEYATFENHPFKHGYGKLVNSGYHFIDLLLWYQSINNDVLLAPQKKANDIQLCGHPNYSVYDDYHSIDYNDLHRLYTNSSTNNQELLQKDELRFQQQVGSTQSLRSFGELDSYNLLQFRNKEYGNVITTASVQLLHKSFSKRSWMELPMDLNKENGRLRHEMLTITVGPLLTIHVRSLQSYEDQKPYQNEEQCVSAHEVGGHNHFEVDIFRNSQLCGGETLQRFDFGKSHNYDEFESLMFEARYNVISDFLSNRDMQDMSILSKNAIDTVNIISSIYKRIASNNQKRMAHKMTK